MEEASQLPVPSAEAAPVRQRMKIRSPRQIDPKNVELLGLSLRRWSKIAQRALDEFDQFADQKIVAKVLMVDGFESIEEVTNAMKELRKMAEDPETPVEVRANCLHAIAPLAKAWVEMSKQIISLKATTSSDGQASAPRGQNLPPMIPIQFQVASGAQVNVGSANSGAPSGTIDIQPE